MAGGWPAYEFGDGLNGFSGIARDGRGRSTFRITRKGQSESPNRLSVEFQDEFNQYQQDSLSLVDFEDAAASGCEEHRRRGSACAASPARARASRRRARGASESMRRETKGPTPTVQ